YLAAIDALTALRRLLPRQLRLSPSPGETGTTGEDTDRRNGHPHDGVAADSHTAGAGVALHNRIADLLAHLDADGLPVPAGAADGWGYVRRTPRSRCPPARGVNCCSTCRWRRCRVSDAQLNTLAVELLSRCGEGPVRRLAQESTNAKNCP